MKKILDFLQKNIIQNIIVKYQRKYKTQGFNLKLPRGFKFNRRLLILVIIGGTILFLIANFLSKSIGVSVSKDIDDQSVLDNPHLDESIYSVVILGFNDLNPESDYRFLDYIVQVKVNSKKSDLRVFGINPYIVLPKGRDSYALTSYHNNIEDKSIKFDELLKGISGLTTQPVDRYVSFNYSDLEKINSLLGLDHRVTDSLKSGEKFYAGGSYINGDQLGDFFTLQQGDVISQNLEEKISYLKNFHLSLKNPFKIFNLLDNSSELTKYLRTDMTSGEFKKFITDISYSEIIREGITDKDDYYQIPEKFEDGFKVSDIIIDEKLGSIFSRLEIISEQAKIEIYNASDIAGLAYSYKRTIENQGGVVVKTGNYPETPKTNTLYVPNSNRDNFVETINLINNTLNGDVTIVSGEYKYNYSGDLILVLVK